MQITSKLPEVGTTIFTVMSKLAADHQAINLSQGFPNFPVDERLLEIVREQSLDNVHQYAPMPGNPRLLNEISATIYAQYEREIRPGEEVIVTAGATQAIFTAITALVHSGEEVIVLDPSYDCYAPAIQLCGAQPVHVSLNEDFLPDWDKIRDSVNSKTRMLIVNNPHNPTGSVWTAQDFIELEKLMNDFPHLLLLSDEVYEFIHFTEFHCSALSLDSIKNRTITVSSFGKTFHITGWKIGYITAPALLMVEIKKVHQFNVFCVNSLAQDALSKYIPVVDLKALKTFYQGKRDFFRSLLKESRFELLPCNGTYFQLASYSNISEQSDIEFAKKMTVEHGVASIPVSVFNKNGEDRKLVRFCFAKDNDTLINAAERLCRI